MICELKTLWSTVSGWRKAKSGPAAQNMPKCLNRTINAQREREPWGACGITILGEWQSGWHLPYHVAACSCHFLITTDRPTRLAHWYPATPTHMSMVHAFHSKFLLFNPHRTRLDWHCANVWPSGGWWLVLCGEEVVQPVSLLWPMSFGVWPL